MAISGGSGGFLLQFFIKATTMPKLMVVTLFLLQVLNITASTPFPFMKQSLFGMTPFTNPPTNNKFCCNKFLKSKACKI